MQGSSDLLKDSRTSAAMMKKRMKRKNPAVAVALNKYSLQNLKKLLEDSS